MSAVIVYAVVDDALSPDFPLGRPAQAVVPSGQMLRALYRQIKRFLDWLNGGGYSVKEAENYRRDHDSGWGGGSGPLSP